MADLHGPGAPGPTCWSSSWVSLWAARSAMGVTERPTQIAQPGDSDITFNLIGNKFRAIEDNISKNEPDIDAKTTDWDVESDNFSETEGSTPWVGLPILTEHATTGRSLRDIVRHETSHDEIWVPFRTESYFELARWFIEAKVPTDHIGRYFRKGLGPESSSIKSAYRLLEAVDELESWMGMKSRR
ncbi:hypothetical protein HOY82DRAFT_607988 [Tuber indicum]|nr:hypothetical protein HOY82DRAFT_607988 [Tuber indicum]